MMRFRIEKDCCCIYILMEKFRVTDTSPSKNPLSPKSSQFLVRLYKLAMNLGINNTAGI
jgi:hypothetical protein